MYLIYSLKRYLFYVFYISQRHVANEWLIMLQNEQNEHLNIDNVYKNQQ